MPLFPCIAKLCHYQYSDANFPLHCKIVPLSILVMPPFPCIAELCHLSILVMPLFPCIAELQNSASALIGSSFQSQNSYFSSETSSRHWSLISGMSGDSTNGFLHCGNVLSDSGPLSVCLLLYACTHMPMNMVQQSNASVNSCKQCSKHDVI